MKIVDQHLLAELIQHARESERQRAHRPLHHSLDDPIQRLCVAINPGSYIPPHRHSQTDKWELFVIFRGSAAILFFSETGQVQERILLSGTGPVQAVEIPAGTWHTLVALERETTLLEIKPGPYTPLTAADSAAWAPAEGEPGAPQFEAFLRHAEPGDTPPC